MSNLPSRYFWELTQPEIAEQFKKNPFVILAQTYLHRTS